MGWGDFCRARVLNRHARVEPAPFSRTGRASSFEFVAARHRRHPDVDRDPSIPFSMDPVRQRGDERRIASTGSARTAGALFHGFPFTLSLSKGSLHRKS